MSFTVVIDTDAAYSALRLGDEPVVPLKQAFASWASSVNPTAGESVLVALWETPITTESPMALVACTPKEMPDVLVSLLQSVGASNVQ